MLEDLEETISSWEQFGTSFRRESFFSHMQPNPISEFKNQFATSLLACVAYCSVLRSMLSLAFSWICFTKSAFFLPSKLMCFVKGKGDKFNGVKGLNLYTISNGKNLVAEWTVLLYANSTCGKHSSHVLMFFLMIALNRVDKVLFTTSVWPSVCGKQ